MVTSCVILNYNDSDSVITLLNYIEKYEDLDYIVIVDNNSTDNSYEILKKSQSAKVHLLLADQNGGYGYGNNIGIKYSYNQLNADYILIANPDVIFTNHCVSQLKKVLLAKKECAISAAVPLKSNREKQNVISWRLPTIRQEIFSASLIFSKLFSSKISYDDDYYLNKEFCYVDVVQGAMLMVDAEKMVKYGMYDEDFFLYCEEQVLAKKFKNIGFKSILLLNVDYIHNHSVSINKTYKSAVKKRRLMFKSKLLYLKKYENINKMLYCFAIFFYRLALFEVWILSLIKNISTRRMLTK